MTIYAYANTWHDVPGSFSAVWRAGMLRASTLLSSAS